jgi:hypothetical protein
MMLSNTAAWADVASPSDRPEVLLLKKATFTESITSATANRMFNRSALFISFIVVFSCFDSF